MPGLSWAALGLRSISLCVKIETMHLQMPFLSAAMLLVSPWAVPRVEGQTILQTLRPQEAGGAGPAPWERGCLQNLLGVSGWEGFPGLGEAAVTGGWAAW